MARAVLADEPGPVDRDEHRLVVLADVVDGLVECPLQEGRVERHDRAHAAHREAGRERHRVLLGDPDIEHPVRELGLNLAIPVPVGMPAVIPTMRRSVRAELDQLRGEDRRVVRVLAAARPARGVGAAASSVIDSVGIAADGPVPFRRGVRVRRQGDRRQGGAVEADLVSRPAGTRGPSGFGRGRSSGPGSASAGPSVSSRAWMSCPGTTPM